MWFSRYVLIFVFALVTEFPGARHIKRGTHKMLSNTLINALNNMVDEPGNIDYDFGDLKDSLNKQAWEARKHFEKNTERQMHNLLFKRSRRRFFKRNHDDKNFNEWVPKRFLKNSAWV